jgi:alkylation response protein AidB-like acyl-CoA dehydrogenase
VSEDHALHSSEIPALDVADLARTCDLSVSWPRPGRGQTARRFDLLGGAAENDLVLGRLVEAHADAVAILDELHGPPVAVGQRWGVWAAGPADGLQACRSGPPGWRLEGSKAWCSGASLVTHALVDASTAGGQQLFAVDLADPGIAVGSPTWVGAGMIRADTRSVGFHQASAVAVGQPDQYLTRPGFWAGAIGVAACWQGGTIAVARPLLARSRRRPEPHLLAHLGAVHVNLEQNRAILAAAARQLDEHFAHDHQLLAGAVRTTVERNAVEVMDRVGRALGPGPLAYDAKHAALVADLTVYIRQHHGEHDLEQIGRRLSELDDDPWSS